MNARKLNIYFGHCTCGNTDIKKLERDSEAMSVYLYRKAVKNEWYFSMAQVGSMYDPYLVVSVKKEKINRGRPNAIFVEMDDNAARDPHLHFVLNGIPGETIMEELRNYWQDRHGAKKYFFTKVYDLEGCFEYMKKQGSFWRTKAYDPLKIMPIRLDWYTREKDLFLQDETRKQ